MNFVLPSSVDEVNMTTYLNLGVGLLGVEADANGEEVVGVAAARKLHAARLVSRVYHRKLQGSF